MRDGPATKASEGTSIEPWRHRRVRGQRIEVLAFDGSIDHRNIRVA